MSNLLRLVACVFFLLSFNAKALVVNGCTIEPNTSCISADLSGANLSNADLTDANLRDANLSNANLSNAYLSFADLSGVNLSGTELSGADLVDADLSGVNLSDADLSGADLFYADLSDANLTNVSGQLSDAYGIRLPSGYIIVNNYIVGAGVNLSSADLSDDDLTDANLTGANLSYADLSGANLNNVSGPLSDATNIKLPSGFIIEALFIKSDVDNDGLSDELEIAISGDATSVDSTTFATTLTNLTADADNDGIIDSIETAAGTSNSDPSDGDQAELSALEALGINKQVPAMGGIGLLALGLSMLGLGAIRIRIKRK